MRTTFLALLCSFALAHAESPAPQKFGAGVALGSPTGFVGKYWLEKTRAIDVGAGFGSYWTMIYADYHWVIPQIFGPANKFTQNTNGYVGIGGGVAFWSKRDYCSRFYCQTNETGTALVVRVPFGGEWFAVKPAFGVFAELAPTFSIIPGVGGSIDFQIGGRYYF